MMNDECGMMNLYPQDFADIVSEALAFAVHHSSLIILFPFITYHAYFSSMLVLVTYDIPDNKRRTKLATFLEGYGRRVQKSVFECFIDLAEMRKLKALVEQRIQLPEDDVRLYWITADAVGRSLTLGGSPPQPPPKSYII